LEKIWAFGEPGQSLKSRMKRDKKEKMELDELNHLLVSLQLRSDEPNTAINQSAVFAAPVSSYMSVLERTKKKKYKKTKAPSGIYYRLDVPLCGATLTRPR
jgi:uncharacterized protein YggL (DUF469 family)